MKTFMSHAAIILALFYLVLYVTDRINGAMLFIENPMTKAILLGFAAVSVYNASVIIRRERALARKRSRSRGDNTHA